MSKSQEGSFYKNELSNKKAIVPPPTNFKINEQLQTINHSELSKTGDQFDNKILNIVRDNSEFQNNLKNQEGTI